MVTLMTLRWTDVGHSTANISTPAMDDAHTINETYFVGEFSNFYLLMSTIQIGIDCNSTQMIFSPD